MGEDSQQGWGRAAGYLLKVGQKGLLVIHLVRTHGARPVQDRVQGLLVQHLHLWGRP